MTGDELRRWAVANTDARSSNRRTLLQAADVLDHLSAKPDRVTDDPRLVASREALGAIPQWRLVTLLRAAGRHVRLLNRVIAERHE